MHFGDLRNPRQPHQWRGLGLWPLAASIRLLIIALLMETQVSMDEKCRGRWLRRTLTVIWLILTILQIIFEWRRFVCVSVGASLAMWVFMRTPNGAVCFVGTAAALVAGIVLGNLWQVRHEHGAGFLGRQKKDGRL
jgi:hypothetical protein